MIQLVATGSPFSGGTFNWSATGNQVTFGTAITDSSGFTSTVPVTGAAAGTTNVTVQYTYEGLPASNTWPVTVFPTISNASGINDIWYFGGITPTYTPDGEPPTTADYALSITLTSSGGASTTWQDTSGSGEVTLSSTSGSSITVTSSGTSFSSSSGDVRIVATTNGVDSQPYTLTTHIPYDLTKGITTDYCLSDLPLYSGYSGYLSQVPYTPIDQLGDPLPNPIDANELLDIAAPDYSGTNWVVSAPNGLSTPILDQIASGYSGTPTLIPVPTCGGAASTPVIHTTQDWFIGSTVPGTGWLTHVDKLQKYVNAGRAQ